MATWEAFEQLARRAYRRELRWHFFLTFVAGFALGALLCGWGR